MNAWNINAEWEPASTPTVNFHFIMTNRIDITPCVIVLLHACQGQFSDFHITDCYYIIADQNLVQAGQLDACCCNTHSTPVLVYRLFKLIHDNFNAY